MSIGPGVITSPGNIPPADILDTTDAFPAGQAPITLSDTFEDEDTRIRGTTNPNNGTILALDAEIEPGPNDHFLEQTILVRTRSTPAPSWAVLITDWDREVNLSQVITEVSVEYEVYNSHVGHILPDEPQTVVSISASDPSGITIVSNETIPTVLSEYENLLTDIFVSAEGNPTIDTVITWDIDPDSDVAVTLTGTRINLFGFMPQRDVSEVLSFGTDVFRSRDGSEQRASFRPRPTVEYEYLYRLDDPERSAALNKLIGSGGRIFSVPVWYELEPLSQDLSIGATTIPVDTRYADYRDTGVGLVLLWRAWNDFEIAPISIVDPFQLTLSSSLEQNHAAGVTLVMPTITAYLPNVSNVSRYRTRLADTTIRWRSIQSTDLERMLSTPDPPTYQGLPLIDDANYMSGTLAEPVTQGYENLTSGGGGVLRRFRPANIPALGSRKTWFTRDDEDRWNLRGLIHKFAGRRKAFYMPTFADDFIPTVGLTAASTALDYEPTDYAEQIMNADPRRDIQVLLSDGSTLERRIVDSTDDGVTVASLTVDSPWGVNAPLADIVRVSILTKVRLDADTLTFQHTDTTETTLSAPTVEVPD